MSQTGTAVAHCPLSNAYFSSTDIFRLREALDCGVRVGLGNDIAGGYELGIQGAMRMSVAVSRLCEGLLKREARARGDTAFPSPRIDWKESLYLATKGGAEAMGLPRVRDGSMSERRLMLNRVRRSLVIPTGFTADSLLFRPRSPPLRPNDQRRCRCAGFLGPRRRVVRSPVETDRRRDREMVVFGRR